MNSKTETAKPTSCASATSSCGSSGKKKRDLILWFSVAILTLSISINFGFELTTGSSPMMLHHFTHAVLGILATMWWSIALGIVIIGLMSKVPRDVFTAIMGPDKSFSGLIRAVCGGVLLDLCCHGILLVAAKLYERGVSLAQVVTFLVASPWNSVSLTLVLIALIGWKWTVLYVIGSMLIALFTGFILQVLTEKNILPRNPNTAETPQKIKLKDELKPLFKNIRFSKSGCIDILKSGWRDGKMIIKWLLFGTIIAASLRTFVPAEMFADWLGPSVSGLFITLLFATVIEICSEGSAPVAGEIVTNAHAPGNGFTFLMAGVATDYTELAIIKELTKSWAIAFAIPLITVPQVLLIGWLMNMAASS